MLGLDALSSVIRATPTPNLEAKPLWIEASVAQQLGLTDGQVVQALIEAKGGSVRLWLKNFSFEMPNGWILKPGDTPFMRVVRGASSWALLIQPRADGTSAASSGAGAAGAGLASAAAAAQPSPAQLLEARMQAMAARPMDGTSLLSLLSARPTSEAAPLQMTLMQAWMAKSMSLAQINPSLLKALVQQGLIPNERRLAQGQPPLPDARSMLKKLLDSLTQSESSEVDRLQAKTVRQGLEAMDSAQAQAALAQAKGALSAHLWLPFADASPLHLHIQRDAPKHKGDDPPFTVDVHTLHASLGEIWLATTIRSSHRVGLVMWALQAQTVNWARSKASLLGAELKDSGLELESFQIHHSPRPRSDIQPMTQQDNWEQTVRLRLDTLA